MASILQTDENQEIGSMQLGQQDQGDISAQSGTSTPGQPIRPPSPKGSGRFMNLQKYISANAPQAQQMAGKIGQGFAERAGQVGQQAQDIQQQFGQRAQQEQDRLGQAGQFAGQLGTAAGAQGILNSPEQLAQFQTARQGQVNVGPGNLNPQQQQLQQLQEQAKMAETEGGRFQLLRQQFGNPSYNLGQRRLDQLLLQNAPGAANQIQQQINPAFAQAQQAVGGAQQDITSKYSALQELAGQTQADINQALTSGISGIESALETAKQNAQTGRTQAMDQFGYNLGAGNLTPEQLQALGPMLQNPYSSLFNVNLREFMTPQEQLSDITMNQIATPEQVQRYAALQQLGGLTGKYSGLTSENGGINNLPIDQERLYQELANRQQSFSQQFRPGVEQYKQYEQYLEKLPQVSGFRELPQLLNQYGSEFDSGLIEYYISNIRNAAVEAGLDQSSVNNIINQSYDYLRQVSYNTPIDQLSSDLQNLMLSSITSQQLGQRNALEQLAQQQGALNMMADLASPDSFGRGDQTINRDDREQFQRLLEDYLGNQVSMFNQPYSPIITGGAGK